MEPIEFIITCKITNADGFRAIAQDMASTTHKEPGCIKYDWYLQGDQGIIHERYVDGDAIVTHVGNVESRLPKLMECCEIQGVHVLANVKGPAKEVLDGFGATYYDTVVRKEPVAQMA